MDREQVIALLQAHEQEFRRSGVASMSLFGSVARGQYPCSDVDVAVRLDEGFSRPGFEYFDKLAAFEGRLREILGCPVDVVEEPVRKPRFQREIDKDRAIAF